ncbi:uncharacterized protein Z520_09575 [Fonsecaea multimorphosa CBS 102226]|uniref:Uncharacterized protein n=1 Tax=Fonsecaea multimorphosa CBS 102226 TaxID=1442371 RepID=A0A0D2GZD4_9EURO|nr:uncharacterized protein Z520_09575 [Fonsecaea multimorphosa CBS 102226]KIX94885.1 hypothetical protein Z520_09575 [Fonsecaea multimorphosa CBS 102226]OAL20462.1 hypothetical protein AYO22_08956 [Fonsecaea multimorphosa]
MSITKLPLQHLTARLVISPAPTTLGESTAVLKKLQSLGPVLSFKTRQASVPRNTEQLDVDIVFSSRATLEKAQQASPFTVKVNYQLPDPKLQDPYNVRNLQSRRQPQPKSMTCRVQSHDGCQLPGQNILSNGFSPSLNTRLHQSLTDLNPPPGIAAGLGVFDADSMYLRSTAQLVDKPPELMQMYRSQISDQTKNHSASSASSVVHGDLPGTRR